MLLIVIVEREQHCQHFQTITRKPQSETNKTLKKEEKNKSEGRGKTLTYKRRNDEKDVQSQACPNSRKECRNRANINNSSRDGNGGEQLDGNDGVDLPNERPSELRALDHHRVQRRGSGLHISLPKRRLVPHLRNAKYKSKDNRETKL